MKYFGIFKDIKDSCLEVCEYEIYEEYFAEFYHKFCDLNKYDLDFYRKEAFSFEDRNIRVLELACGTGRISLQMLKLGCSIEAIDLSKSMLDILERDLKSIGRKFKNNINIKQMNILDINYENQFDMVIFPATTICLLKKDEIKILLEKVYKSLKIGGKFIFDYKDEDKLKTGFFIGERMYWKIGENEECIYQEFKDYNNRETHVNFYVEKEGKRYLSSTKKNMIMKDTINRYISESSFSSDNHFIEKIEGNITMNVLKK